MAVSLPAPVKRTLLNLMRERDWPRTWGTAAFFVRPIPRVTPFIALIGLGRPDQPIDRTREAIRRGVGAVVLDARQHGLSTLSLLLKGLPQADQLARAALEGTSLANYSFTEFSERLLARAERQVIRSCTVVVDSASVKAARAALAAAEPVLTGTNFARTLVNRPAGHMSPKTLVDEATRIVQKNPAVFSLTVLNRAEARAQGFTAFLAVAQGSSEEPYVIHVRYTPREGLSARKKIWLVGKGITFDSGGLSLKPAEFMEDMKADMAGAATVLGVFEALSALLPDVEVAGVICACENMPSGTAYRPGDVVKTKSGKTIEVVNTDAEGRITLADALTYAVQHKPDAIIDFATLTGASMVGLGETVAGLWGTNEELLSALQAASAATGEQVARLPMPDEYQTLLESRVADLRNITTTRFGGAITAAMFLREFTGDIPWAHFDIAGPSYLNRPYISYWGLGATGFGVRTAVQYLLGSQSGYVKSS